MSFIMDMDIEEFDDLVSAAFEKEKEEQLRQEWLTLYPFMLMKTLNYMSLSQYIDERTGKNIDTRPAEVIIQEIEELHRKEGTHGDF